jgi:glycine/D-amino acid oxidase-like deaminating enzyme
MARSSRSTVRTAIAIVGGGVAGLSAAWELDRRGMHDFVVLELGTQAGGNARSGENNVSAYPWAAHYIPVPDERATLLRELLTELGVLKNGVWEERYLCFAPQERLFMHGDWHPALEPEFALDRTSMSDWMRAHDLTSPALQWYVDYACRDDYGALARDTSAWAGVHYFASRSHDEQGPLTWPEGNGWVVRRLLEKLGRYVHANTPVYRAERRPARNGTGAWRVLTPHTEYLADAVVFTAPSFVAPYVVEGMEGRHSAFVYSPWLTANLTLDRWPAERNATRTPPAWDNVIYDSPALGYVVATHQSLRSREPRDAPTVWTFYWSLAEGTPAEGRRLLQAKDWAWWRDRILADLALAHPDIGDCVSRIDVMRHGHAMIRPTVGFLTERERLDPQAPPRFHLANSDRGGLSLFEEAQYNGVMAARRALRDVS